MSMLETGLKVGLGIFRGFGNMIRGAQEAEAQRAEAGYNLAQLDLQYNRLEDTFRENQLKLQESLDQALDQNQQGIWATEIAQRNNLITSSVSNAENQDIMYTELASLQRQNLQSVGSAEQMVATSGFRNTGSGANAIHETERVAGETYDQARRQIQLSAYQGYMQAADAYFSANIQLEGYRESSRNALTNFDIQSSMLESQYNYDREVTSGEIGYWQAVYDNSNYTFLDGLADFFGGF